MCRESLHNGVKYLALQILTTLSNIDVISLTGIFQIEVAKAKGLWKNHGWCQIKLGPIKKHWSCLQQLALKRLQKDSGIIVSSIFALEKKESVFYFLLWFCPTDIW